MKQEGMINYILKGIPEYIWKIAKKRAIDDGKSMKQILLDAIKKYAEGGENES